MDFVSTVSRLEDITLWIVYECIYALLPQVRLSEKGGETLLFLVLVEGTLPDFFAS